MSSPPSKKLRKNSRVPAAYGGIDSSWDESDSPHRRGDSRPAPSRTYYGVCMHQCHHLNLNVFFLFNIISSFGCILTAAVLSFQQVVRLTWRAYDRVPTQLWTYTCHACATMLTHAIKLLLKKRLVLFQQQRPARQTPVARRAPHTTSTTAGWQRLLLCRLEHGSTNSRTQTFLWQSWRVTEQAKDRLDWQVH